MPASLPDLRQFRLHKVIDDVDFEGEVVPGLRGTFYRRSDESVGVYDFAGQEVFMAWGYIGEEHCRFNAVRRADGIWDSPRPGCPDITALRTS